MTHQSRGALILEALRMQRASLQNLRIPNHGKNSFTWNCFWNWIWWILPICSMCFGCSSDRPISVPDRSVGPRGDLVDRFAGGAARVDGAPARTATLSGTGSLDCRSTLTPGQPPSGIGKYMPYIWSVWEISYETAPFGWWFQMYSRVILYGCPG